MITNPLKRLQLTVAALKNSTIAADRHAVEIFAEMQKNADLFEHLIECAKAAGFASITEAIAAAKAARDPWTPIAKGLPIEPGWYLAMLAPDNDWGLMSNTPLQVEFDAYTSKPKAFTCF
jgi:hypothetical protein